jgi:hypothetical protein
MLPSDSVLNRPNSYIGRKSGHGHRQEPPNYEGGEVDAEDCSGPNIPVRLVAVEVVWSEDLSRPIKWPIPDCLFPSPSLVRCVCRVIRATHHIRLPASESPMCLTSTTCRASISNSTSWNLVVFTNSC